jgi:predicted phage tail protein
MSMGASMVLGGIVQLLSPTPKIDSGIGSEDALHRPSYNFNGVVNTTAQGHPVALAYGRVICGSAVISAGLTQT